MLGVSHHSPAVLTVLIDRTKFRTHNVSKADPETVTRIKNFMSLPDDGRQRVVFVEEIQALSIIAKSDIDTKQLKFVVFDGADKLTKLGEINIIDAMLKDNTVWQMSKLMPDVFNGSLTQDACGANIPVDEIDKDIVIDPKEKKRLKKLLKEQAEAGKQVDVPVDDSEDEDDEEKIENLLAADVKADDLDEQESSKAKVAENSESSDKSAEDKPKRNWQPKANQLSGMLTDVLGQLDKETKIDLRRATLEYAAGLRSKKVFSTSRKSAVKAGASDETIGEIVSDLESAFGEKIYTAYYDMSMYGTSAEAAAKNSGVDINELLFLTHFIPPSEDHEFCWPAPVGLDEKRKKT